MGTYSPLPAHDFVAALIGGPFVDAPPAPADAPLPVGASAVLPFALAAPFSLLVLGSVSWLPLGHPSGEE